MKDSRKEFIKKAHSAACSDWKQNIEKEFPKLFKKDDLVVGKWYKLTKDYGNLYKGSVFPFIKYQDSFEEFAIVGHSIFDDSKTDYSAPPINTLTPATNKEVEEALIKEAKRRGFKEGVRIKSKWMPNISANKLNGKFMFDNKFELCVATNGLMIYTIFQNGFWAAIVETITKEQAEKELGKTILN